MNSILIQKNGVVTNGQLPVEGMDYLDPSDTIEKLRELGVEPVYDVDNKLIAKSRYAIDAVERKVIENQTIPFGPNKGKKVGEVYPISDDVLIGFVNYHTSDDLDGRGDKKWYEFGGSKIRHKGDTLMTKTEAVEAGIEIG